MKLLAISKTSFAEGSFASLYSIKIDPQLREILDYLLMSVTDAGLGDGVVAGMGSTISSMIPGQAKPYSSLWRECMNGVPPIPHDPRPFNAHTFAQMWQCLAGLILIAFVVLVIEILTKMRSCRKTRPIQKPRQRKVRPLPFSDYVSQLERDAWRIRNEAAASRMLWYKNRTSRSPNVSMWNTRFRTQSSGVARSCTQTRTRGSSREKPTTRSAVPTVPVVCRTRRGSL